MRIVATESSRLVDIGERVPFTAQPVHVIDGGNLDKPVVATLRGNASVDPAGSKQDAPAAILYTAPAVPDDGGIVTLKSTSNRGIGTLTIEFKTRPPTFKIDEPSGGGRIRGVKCDGIDGDWVVEGTYDRLGFKGKQKWVIVIDEATMRGTFTYTDDQVGTPTPDITVYLTGKAKGEATLSVDTAGVATFQLRETAHTFKSTTSLGGAGSDLDAPLASTVLVWQPNATCP